MISNSVKFLLNDKILEIKNPDPNQTILNYIRTELKKTGTKEGCSEGGCGACTIVLGELVSNDVKYSSINSCISFVPSLNGKQLLIVEDLVSKDGKLHPVQEAMVKFHGSQCGFCTPGFVMSLFSMFKNNKSYNSELITDSISGNLCRCTGYRPIIDAAKSLNKISKTDEFSKNKNKTIKLLKTIKPNNIFIKKDDKVYFSPKNVKELKKTGTKEGCSEGGCGACTIVLGELVSNDVKYSSINSCISFVPSLNGKQLLIVEDLVSKDGKLHPCLLYTSPSPRDIR